MSHLIDEQNVVRPLLKRAKLTKEEAKDYRDDGDISAAVHVLESTVDALQSVADTFGLTSIDEPSRTMRELASQLADCWGMLGGNYRRQGRLQDAQKAFERGRLYEESATLEVMSSYNVVNAITLPIEMDTKGLAAQRPFIENAVGTLSRQVRGERRNDRWAWADLAQCQLLLGNEAAALQSYARVKDLGGGDTIASVAAVLNRLATVQPKLKKQVASVIEFLKN